MATYTAATAAGDEPDGPSRQNGPLYTEQSTMAALSSRSKDGTALTTAPAPDGRRPSPGPSSLPPPSEEAHPPPPFPLPSQHQYQSSWQRFWATNKGAVMVAVSQFFGAQMNLFARLLARSSSTNDDNSTKPIHPIQLLLLRQSVTALFCLAYMRWRPPPGGVFGEPRLRPLLAVRGVAGFFGIMGMWTSMLWLPLADATVITFLAPGVAGVLCFFVLGEPFTRAERAATLVALLGVVFIAQPASLFSTESNSSSAGNADGSEVPPGSTMGGTLPGKDHVSTAQERLVAVCLGLLGVLGAAVAFTTLRCIGKRAHPLISVTWFALTSTAICLAVLAAAPALDVMQPSLRFALPADARSWLLLLSLGALGFVMQYLLTAGLAADKSNRANSMVYTHMLFAVAFDKWVFEHDMGFMSFVGCALILGSAVGVVFVRRPPSPSPSSSPPSSSHPSPRSSSSPFSPTSASLTPASSEEAEARTARGTAAGCKEAGRRPARLDLEAQREGETSPMLVGIGGHAVHELPLEGGRR
ncbi:hypothetical protein N3K66_002619 [Trichothecium roseum]|uniref:Uncharacterized protein n=1 Tax=Trichothecium roseum TaxID=47278 RepID=A0ACC0VA14_9HYPO|nr:hypothetical protein N3K66_002619 [Trichothecium roseum]